MNRSSQLVSCIIIFFNTNRQFFIEAIESVFNQTYDNWELILVDDGSTNTSTEIALEYVLKHPEKVRYLEHDNHQNLGMSATRNLGSLHAQGEYIAFLDADDLWLPDTLTEQTAILESYPEAAMVYGAIQWWYSWTGNLEQVKSDFIDTPQIFSANPNTYLDRIVQPPILFTLLLQMKISISGMLLRRQVIDKIGGFENVFRGLYEDQVLCTKVCIRFPVFVSSQCWYKYRQHPNSCCAIAAKTNREYWQLQRPVFLGWVEQYLSEIDLKDTAVWNLVQTELWMYRYPLLSSQIQQIQALTDRIKQKVQRITRSIFRLGEKI
jgi:glycosyltransferase involved in cell wall biosynthesis